MPCDRTPNMPTGTASVHDIPYPNNTEALLESWLIVARKHPGMLRTCIAGIAGSAEAPTKSAAARNGLGYGVFGGLRIPSILGRIGCLTTTSRFWLRHEIEAFGNRIPPGALILDAGAGNQIYRNIFAAHRYESADFEKVDKRYAPSTYVCDLASIPVEDARFDAVVFSQVMEHLPDPKAAVRELHRVLKPGGLLFYSAPLFYEEHEVPFDFYRYTQFGARHIFEGAGFKIEEFRWLEGYMGTLHYQLRRFSKNAPFSPKALGGGPWAWAMVVMFVVLMPVMWLTATIAKKCDVRYRYTKSGFPLNYMAIVSKEAPSNVKSEE